MTVMPPLLNALGCRKQIYIFFFNSHKMCCYFFIKRYIELWIHWKGQRLHLSVHQNVWMCVWAVFVVLQGSSSCEIENHGGVVTLRPLPGCVCLLNHREVTEPCRLAQGQLVSIKKQNSLVSLLFLLHETQILYFVLKKWNTAAYFICWSEKSV